MSRLVLVVLILSVALSACIPGLSPISAADSQTTAIALAGTLAAQTMLALPSPTILPTNTPTITVSPTAAVTRTRTPTRTPAASSTPATVTIGTITVTVTGILPTSAAGATAINTPGNTPGVGFGTATPTDLMIPRTYGTQPPLVDYGRVTLINQAKSQVYISFQCKTPEGVYVVVEYPVGGTITVSIPAGSCHYVAWVGGRQFIGDIKIGRFEEFTFKFRKDRIIIQ